MLSNMGGGGNQKWESYYEPNPITGPTPKIKEKRNETWEIFEKKPKSSRRQKTDKEKKIEAWKKQKSQTAEAKAERERKQTLKKMTAEQRTEHRADKKMFDRFLKKEYSKWEKSDSKGGHTKGWLPKLEQLKKRWNQGGKKHWESKNKNQAKSIREKVRREEAWRIKRSQA
jgi:hypothetical protein